MILIEYLIVLIFFFCSYILCLIFICYSRCQWLRKCNLDYPFWSERVNLTFQLFEVYWHSRCFIIIWNLFPFTHYDFGDWLFFLLCYCISSSLQGFDGKYSFHMWKGRFFITNVWCVPCQNDDRWVSLQKKTG